MSSYARPAGMREALELLSARPCRVLAGGTDLYPLTGAELGGDVLDLTALSDLRGIRTDPGGLRIGACTSWSEIAETPLPAALAGLQAAARQIGGRQVQNSGTIGGNLCNASPAADGVPPLLVLEAEVELVSPRGSRRMALADFLLGPRRTALAAGEILAAVILPDSALRGTSTFLKLGARAYLVISITMAALRWELEGGRFRRLSLAVGACSPTARRLHGLEAALTGLPPSEAAARVTEAALSADLAPIDDIRATGAYRLTAAAELLRRGLREATE